MEYNMKVDLEINCIENYEVTWEWTRI